MNKKHFSLIEIALSLGVAFLAVTVLIAFFPTSFTRIKNSQQSSYATNAMQQFSVHLKNTLTSYPIPARYRTTDASTWNTEYQDYLTKWEQQVKTTNDDSATNPLPTAIYTGEVTYPVASYPIPAGFEGTLILRHQTNPSLFFIQNVTVIDGTSHVDNTFEARISKSPYIFGSNLFTSAHEGSGRLVDCDNYENDYSKAARINIEISWPIGVPYGQRKFKKHSFLDLAK